MAATPGYQDRDTLRRALEANGWNSTRTARAFGCSRDTINRWKAIHEIELPPDIIAVGRTVATRADYVAKRTKETNVSLLSTRLIEALAKVDTINVIELCDELDVAPARVRAALDELRAAGYSLDVADDTATLRTTRRAPLQPSDNVTKAYFEGDDYEFAVVSDVHLGSTHDNVEALRVAYEMIADYGITDVYNPGDLVCGKGIYPGQINDIRVHTFNQQVEYALQHYPKIDGITTKIIAGNHDIEGDFGRIGANPVVAFCNERDDFEYLGEYSAWIELPNGARMHMLHPRGGGSYATSYKAQKIVEGYEGGTKPNILLCGHWHRRGHFGPRGVETFLCGTFEGQSNLGIRLGLGEPDNGFYRIKVRLGDDGSIVKTEAEWHKFYRGRFV